MPGEVRLAFGRLGEGPEPLLALHGITQQHRMFNTLARNLQYPDGVVSLDLRGRGDFAKPSTGNYVCTALLRYMNRTIDQLYL